jgi:peptidoglycan-N-acetylglucosamine deacetylase
VRRAALVGAGTAAVAGHALPALAPVSPPVARALGIRRRHDGPEALLTFDDGPSAEATPRVLDALQAGRRRATFFLVGEQVRRRPAIAAEITAAGHTVALHGERHRSHLRLTPAQVRDDLRRGAATLADATGAMPRTYRPPYGILSSASLRVVRAEGLELMLWTRWGRDWTRRATAESVTARVTRDVARGDVLLLHDADEYSAPGCWRATVEALPRILEILAARDL